jgi:hypothetical protein
MQGYILIEMNGIPSKPERLKQKITELDIAIPGYIRTIYQQCGQSNCRCKKNKKHWHGPYYLWGRRLNGKLSSKSIHKRDVPLYNRWIKNRMKLKAIVSEMLNAGCKYATEYKAGNKPKN